MFQLLPKLFTSPTSAWVPIRQHADTNPWGFVPVLLIFSLVPALSTFIGTAFIGWAMYGSEVTHYLNIASAFYLAAMAYLGFITCVIIMAFVVRWVLFRTSGRPTLPVSLTFTTCLALPVMLGGIAAVIPYRLSLLIIAPLAVFYSALLLFKGMPVYMHIKRNDETRFHEACILAVGFLVVLTTGFAFMEFWWNPLSGAEYLASPIEPATD
ncbi:MAG TPA: DUF1282 domain-containing protein [Pseudomonas xinjiangensis]|uniref:DUF1282 domain-containing protein n=2 Tax=root TaxID=1 RepID=A0A7V1FRR5_9GAMM|nr:DUF1282 domain-containing protein [Halopseudomonas xinjiangensis]HEC48013.1 DUF1282 domain-containing protein [Halopseudomonas xinjiangensis]